MIIVVFILLTVTLYGYLIHRIWKMGKMSWLAAVIFALLVKLGTIVYMILHAPVE